MTTMTVERVSDEVREWKSPDGKLDLRFVTLIFTDGSEGSVSTKPDTVDKRLAQLKELIGKPAEFELEDKGKHHGAKQWKVTDYPGKAPQGGFGGKGGGKWQPRSPEERAEILAMNAMTALSNMVAEQTWSDALPHVKQAMGELLGEAKRLLSVGLGDGALAVVSRPSQPEGSRLAVSPPEPVSEDEQARIGRLVTTAEGYGEGPDADDSLADEDGGVASAAPSPSAGKALMIAGLTDALRDLKWSMGKLVLRARNDWGVAMTSPNLALLSEADLATLVQKLTEELSA